MKVTIKFIIPDLPVAGKVDPICRLFAPTPCYADNAALAGSVYDTNVCGWGHLAGLMPMGTSTNKLAWIERAFNSAVAAKKNGTTDAGVEFEIATNEDQLYWLQVKDALKDQNFEITVDPDGTGTVTEETTEE